MKKLLSFITVFSLLCTFLPRVHADFTDTGSWEAYDAGANGVGTDPDGYSGMIFDGRYIYFTPDYNGADKHGEFLRFDTKDVDGFEDSGSWATYDPGANGVGTDVDGYFGGAFDGRYVYFSPYDANTSSTRNGEVLRYDTTSDFQTASSYSVFDTTTVNANAKGFMEAVYDGRYVYFSPYSSAGETLSGVFARFDTEDVDGFTDSGSWAAVDVGSKAVGQVRGTFDGRYLYFAPRTHSTASSTTGNVLRYDTQATFTNLASWTNFDPGENGVGTDPDGYYGVDFDGNYLYFAPGYNGSASHKEVLRYDVKHPAGFEDASSWTTHTPSVGTRNGYSDVVFDGRYMLFTPYLDGSTWQSEAMRYDTMQPFDDDNAWEIFDIATNVNSNLGGMRGALFDGDFVYFAPFYNGSAFTGMVARFDTSYEGVYWITSNPRTTAEGLNQISYYPRVPLENGDSIILKFTDDWDAKFDGGGDDIVDADVSVNGTNISSTVETIDDANNQITSVITTNGSDVTSPITITIGDGLSGSLNDLTNPTTSGVFAVALIHKDSSNTVIHSGNASVEIGGGSASVGATAIVNEALVMTMDSTSVSLQVDPSVNGGEDKSEGTILTVASNASGGYSIYGKLDDGSGNAQLVSGANTIASSTGENGFSYDATNNASSCSSPDGTKTFASSAAVLQNSSSQDVGYTEETDSYQHALCYDLNVNYNTPAGVYTGTITYTVVASF